MRNDNSYEFWLDYYKNYFKQWCELMLHDYKNSLIELLNELKESYKSRNDKQSNDPIIKDSIKGQLNQIKAIESIFK